MIPLLGTGKKIEVAKLQKQQNKIVHNIPQLTSTQQVYEKTMQLNIIDLTQMDIFKILHIRMITNGEITDKYIQLHKNNEIYNYNTRINTNSHNKKTKTQIGQSKIFNGMKTYNELPNDIKILDKQRFKKQLKNYTKYLNDLDDTEY